MNVVILFLIQNKGEYRGVGVDGYVVHLAKEEIVLSNPFLFISIIYAMHTA